MRNWSANQVELILIRHGKTMANEEHRYIGRSDEALSDKGRSDIRDKKSFYDRMGLLECDLFVCSPMLRCRETAEILFKGKKVQVIPEWTEIDFGLFEGKNHRELSGNMAYQEWIDSNGTLPFPGGESREEFIDRSIAGLKSLKSMAKEAKKIAAVVHGGTIMALASYFDKGDYFDYQIKNGQMYRLVLEEEQWWNI